MIKSLKDISWDVPEIDYREDKSLSYSKISDFLRNGPKALINNEKKDSPALRFGSLVDCLLTAEEEFDDRFYVVDMNKISDTIRRIVENIYHTYWDYDSIGEIGYDILDIVDEEGYQPNYKPETKIKKIIELGGDYFKTLRKSEGKMVISEEEYNQAKQCIQTLKTHRFTYKLFQLESYEEIFYQLKFRTNIYGVNSRCMFDIIKVDHKNKTIEPIDLKTTGKSEEDFEKSFIDWNYWIQCQMYSEILTKVISEDEYFHDFTILDFKFCVINKFNLSPLIWDSCNIEEESKKIKEKFGWYWWELLKDAAWHLKQNKFNYSRASYENGGKNKIVVKL